jgi:tetratricopeptide (TPR) repeat protein
MTHHDREVLASYVDGGSPLAAEIETHAAACPACTAAIEELHELAAMLRDDPAERDASAARAAVLAEVVEQQHDEDAVAPALCDEILERPMPWRLQHARRVAGTRTAGIVKELLLRWRTTLEREPSTTLQMTELAIELASTLDPDFYPPVNITILLGRALRSHGYVLAFLSRYREGLVFADRAKELLEQTPGMEYELARVTMVRAAAIQWVGEAGDAARLLREAGCTFLAYGDRTWYVNARMTEGVALHSAGAIESALEIWRSLEGAPELTELEAVRLTHNIALALSDLGQAEAAIAPAQRCIADFDRLGHVTEATRSRMCLGRALTAAGTPYEAIPVLRQAQREYFALNMVIEACLCSLDIAEALLATNQAADVPGLCREVIGKLAEAGMERKARVALAYLQEALALRNVTPFIVRDARRFLRRECVDARPDGR